MKNQGCFSVCRLVRLLSFLACLALNSPTFAACDVKADMLTILDGLGSIYEQFDSSLPERQIGLAAVAAAKATVSGIPDIALTPFDNILCPLLQAQVNQIAAVLAELKSGPFAGLIGAGLVTDPSTNPPQILRDQIPPLCKGFAHGSNMTLTSSLLTGSITAMTDSVVHSVCNQDILGENVASACIVFPLFASAGEVFAKFVADCSAADGATNLKFIGETLIRTSNAIGDIGQDIGNGIGEVKDLVNSSTANIMTNDNTNRDKIIANDNANTAKIINELQTLACEMTRLLHTPNGQRESSLPSCQGKPGFPYKWNQNYPY